MNSIQKQIDLTHPFYFRQMRLVETGKHKPPSNWVRWVILGLLISGLLYSRPVKAEGVDKAAHFGLSYVGTSFIYGYTKRLGCSKLESYIFAASTMTMIGLAKEAMDRKADVGDIKANALGTLTFGLGALVWDF